MLSMNWDH